MDQEIEIIVLTTTFTYSMSLISSEVERFSAQTRLAGIILAFNLPLKSVSVQSHPCESSV